MTLALLVENPRVVGIMSSKSSQRLYCILVKILATYVLLVENPATLVLLVKIPRDVSIVSKNPRDVVLHISKKSLDVGVVC